MTPFAPDKKVLRRRLSKYGSDEVTQLLALQKADYASKGVEEDQEVDFAQVEALLREITQEGDCLTVKGLAVNGNDLLTLGVQPGKIIGQCMTFLLQLVQDEFINNNKEELLNAAKEFFANNQEESL
jgi:tRNA nucleotidyltransferase (CCA-adding enzyme)